MPKSLAESWTVLEAQGVDVGRSADGAPYVPPRMPNYDDEEPLSTMFFRGEWKDVALDDLTLPRTYFGRSLLESVSFRGSDLSESRMCWNDFVKCDFTGARLRGCDLRASIFSACIFRNADLAGADLRRATFVACLFEGANLADLTADEQFARKGLRSCMTVEDQRQVNWVQDPGTEPPGG